MRKFALFFVNLVLLFVFAYFAWLQHDDSDTGGKYEDPSLIDVWIWISFYGLVAAGFLLALFRKYPWPLFLVVIAFCVFEFVQTGPGVITNFTGGNPTLAGEAMNAAKPEIEQSREFFGAVIALVAIGFLWLQRCGCCSKKS